MYELKEEDKRSYPELEGKVIRFTTSKKSTKVTLGKVVGCDYYIGVTIVNADDQDDYLLCAHGPMSPIYKGKDRSCVDPQIWDTRFALILETIKSEHLDCQQYLSKDLIGRAGNNPSADSCSFNQ